MPLSGLHHIRCIFVSLSSIIKGYSLDKLLLLGMLLIAHVYSMIPPRHHSRTPNDCPHRIIKAMGKGAFTYRALTNRWMTAAEPSHFPGIHPLEQAHSTTAAYKLCRQLWWEAPSTQDMLASGCHLRQQSIFPPWRDSSCRRKTENKSNRAGELVKGFSFQAHYLIYSVMTKANMQMITHQYRKFAFLWKKKFSIWCAQGRSSVHRYHTKSSVWMGWTLISRSVCLLSTWLKKRGS